MKYVFLDVECSGLIGTTKIRQEVWPRICELYAVTYDEENKVAEFDSLIDPGRKISSEIVGITGITNEMLEGQPDLKSKSEEIRAIIEDADFAVAHNLTFDKTVIDCEYLRLGLPPIKWPALLCTVEESSHYLMRRLKLSELHEFLFGEGFPAAHRAKNDVEALVRCFIEMHKRGDI